DLPPLIFIDEPELGLHPYAIHLLASLLRSAAESAQVIVATQSVTLLNQFDPEEIIVTERARSDGHFESVFRRYTSEELKEWLDEYSMGELWEKNVIGGRPST
ncbi:AAA family ATPase, partial [Candidatus Sumerlaeota bacterium]|nr:AAA family ATPase [Candidatus Sumerlaeota bacterium]